MDPLSSLLLSSQRSCRWIFVEKQDEVNWNIRVTRRDQLSPCLMSMNTYVASCIAKPMCLMVWSVSVRSIWPAGQLPLFWTWQSMVLYVQYAMFVLPVTICLTSLESDSNVFFICSKLNSWMQPDKRITQNMFTGSSFSEKKFHWEIWVIKWRTRPYKTDNWLINPLSPEFLALLFWINI